MTERAWSEKVGPAELEQYSYAGAAAIRMDVALNPYTSAETLTRLAVDLNIYVREAVRDNPHTPPLVRVWLQGGYSDMSLKEFLEAAK